MPVENDLDAPETGQQRIQASPTGIDAPQRATFTPANDASDASAEQTRKPSEENQNTDGVGLPPHSPTFKEQVYGYARLIRGTVLGRPDVKEQGTQVLRGEKGIPLRRGSQ